MKKALSVSIAFAVLLVAVPQKAMLAQRAIPDDNLAYPVLIQLSNGFASGFYLNTNSSVYLVTAKHVLVNQTGKINLLSYSRDPKETVPNVLDVDLGVASQRNEIKLHPTADVAVIRIASVTSEHGSSTLPGVTVRSSAPTGLLGTSMDTVKKYGDVLIANEVLLFGYPTSIGMQEYPQLDPLRPLLRRGIVAGLNPSKKSIVIDCPSYPGNSGGPVVEIDHQGFGAKISVIGVVSELVPFAEKSMNFPIQYQSTNITNSGYTIVTPMDFVLELVK